MTLSVPPLLAFQVWDAVGWVGQVLFTVRIVHQWLASERAGRSHVTAAFWWYSLVGTVLLIVYTVHRQDPVFILGFLVNLFLYARNLQLALGRVRPGARGTPLGPVLLGLCAFAAVTVLSLWRKGSRTVVAYDVPWAWLVVGFLGQALWSGRFLVQWYVSERLGRSVLPASFFWMSLLGAPLLFAYAVHQRDWVMMVAYALNPIPYVRNLVLLARPRRAAPDAAAPGGGGGPEAG